jgi:hypothetical protein
VIVALIACSAAGMIRYQVSSGMAWFGISAEQDKPKTINVDRSEIDRE